LSVPTPQSDHQKLPSVETVLGSISADRLGITLLHEHLLWDISCWHKEPAETSRKQYVDKPVSIEDLWILRRDPFISKSNLKFHDVNIAIEELKHFKRWGGGSVVCQTLPGAGRDPLSLRTIALETGLNIITATGWYVRHSHPPEISGMKIDELEEIMVRELTEEIDNAGIRAGLIGECGCSTPLPYHPEEKKVLRAACRAQARTRVALTFHPSLWDLDRKAHAKTGHAYVELIENEGADLAKFFLSHADTTCTDLEYHRKLLEKGITLSYDCFGRVEGYGDHMWPNMRTTNDTDRVQALVKLCQEGYDRQLVISQDVCFLIKLKKYGGFGYSHVLEHICPILRSEGLKAKQVRNILIENPKRLLGH